MTESGRLKLVDLSRNFRSGMARYVVRDECTSSWSTRSATCSELRGEAPPLTDYVEERSGFLPPANISPHFTAWSRTPSRATIEPAQSRSASPPAPIRAEG